MKVKYVYITVIFKLVIFIFAMLRSNIYFLPINMLLRPGMNTALSPTPNSMVAWPTFDIPVELIFIKPLPKILFV